jgi:hypothetical protein
MALRAPVSRMVSLTAWFLLSRLVGMAETVPSGIKHGLVEAPREFDAGGVECEFASPAIAPRLQPFRHPQVWQLRTYGSRAKALARAKHLAWRRETPDPCPPIGRTRLYPRKHNVACVSKFNRISSKTGDSHAPPAI